MKKKKQVNYDGCVGIRSFKIFVSYILVVFSMTYEFTCDTLECGKTQTNKAALHLLNSLSCLKYERTKIYFQH